MKTKAKIIDETLNAYLPEAQGKGIFRAVKSLACVIQTEDGRCCGVGRCMTKAAKDSFARTSGPEIGFGQAPYRPLEKSLKGQYKGHCESFWNGIQRFHDTPEFWDNEQAARAQAARLHEQWDGK